MSNWGPTAINWNLLATVCEVGGVVATSNRDFLVWKGDRMIEIQGTPGVTAMLKIRKTSVWGVKGMVGRG